VRGLITCRHTEIVASYLDLLESENATLRHALENVLCYENTRWTVCDDVACGHHKCVRRRADIAAAWALLDGVRNTAAAADNVADMRAKGRGGVNRG